MAARKRFTEEQIIAVLKEAGSGMKTADLCRKHNVSDATVYKWKAKYAGMEVSDLRKMRLQPANAIPSGRTTGIYEGTSMPPMLLFAYPGVTAAA